MFLKPLRPGEWQGGFSKTMTMRDDTRVDLMRAKECRCSNRLITVYPKFYKHTSISASAKERVGALDCRHI